MWTRATRWVVAGFVGLAMSSVGCAKGTAIAEEHLERFPVVDDDSLVYALDTSVEMRAIDRLELDSLLSERDIRIIVFDGVLSITGEVWTPVEKQRVGELVRGVAGTIDVTNDLAVRPPS
jgi:osmotically-inducible protein OsmY